MKNLKSKNAFTVIELIFVILILGILGSFAFTKLFATRDDAKQVVFEANVATCIKDVGANYIATGDDVTNLSIASFSSCSSANNYIASSIEANSTTSIKVSNTGVGLDGVHTFGGTCMICGSY